MVGATGFEPVISRSQSERLTGLGHAPNRRIVGQESGEIQSDIRPQTSVATASGPLTTTYFLMSYLPRAVCYLPLATRY